MNFPVSFAGIVINPGDIIVGDSDGLLAIRPDEHSRACRDRKKIPCW